MTWRMGVDLGGTFTDVCLFDEDSGKVEVWKVSSTPDDPSRGIANGVAESVDRVRIEPAGIGYFGHGTTVGTNALIQHRGVTTGLITTDGFRDLLEIGRQKRVRTSTTCRPTSRPSWSRATCVSKCRSGCAMTAPWKRNSTKPRCATRRGAARGRRRGGGRLLPLQLRAAAPRADRARASSPRNSPRPSSASSHEVAPEFREYERMSHHRGERLSRPGHAALHQPAAADRLARAWRSPPRRI